MLSRSSLRPSLSLLRSSLKSKFISPRAAAIGPPPVLNGASHCRWLGSKSPDDAQVFEVSSSSFQSKVMQSKVPVVLDCYADWCGPCRTLGPLLEKHVRAQNGSVVMAKLDTDRNPQLAQSLQIKSLPTVMTVFKGKLVDQFIGAQPENVVKEYVARARAAAAGAENGNEQDPVKQAEVLLAQAQEAMAKKTVPMENVAQIFKQLADIPMDDFEEKEAERIEKVKALSCAGLVRCALEQKDLDSAKILIELIESEHGKFKADPEVAAVKAAYSMAVKSEQVGGDLDDLLAKKDSLSLEQRLQLSQDLISTGRFEEGAELAIEIIKKDRNFQDGAAKTLLVDMFEQLGAAHDLTKKYRRKLANYVM